MHTYSVLLSKDTMNYGFKISYLHIKLQLANHCNIALNEETLPLLHPLGNLKGLWDILKPYNTILNNSHNQA